MALFVDTRALLKAYVVERRGSEVMREILTRSEFEAGIFVSSTVILETYGCIARKWRRKIIDDRELRTAWEELRRDVDTLLLGVVEHSPDLIDRAIVLAAAHRDIDAGGMDCLHVAIARDIESIEALFTDDAEFYHDGRVPPRFHASAPLTAGACVAQGPSFAGLFRVARFSPGISHGYASHTDLRQLRFGQVDDGPRPIPSLRYCTPGSRSACVA